MFKDVSEKLGKLAKPGWSFTKKLKKLKLSFVKKILGISNAGDTGSLSAREIELFREQLKKTTEELNKKIEEQINSNTEQIKIYAESTKNIDARIAKIEQIISFRKSGTGSLSAREIELFREQLKKITEELNKKIEEQINSKTEQIKIYGEAAKNLDARISKIEQIVSSGKRGTEGTGRSNKPKLFIKKILGISNAGDTGYLSAREIEPFQEQLKKTTEELNKKIEEQINSKTEQIKIYGEAAKNLDARISKIEQIISSGKKGTEDFEKRLDRLDEIIPDLLSLYEVVSSTVNPFVDDRGNNVIGKLAELEKKLEEMGNKTSEIPSNVIIENALVEKELISKPASIAQQLEPNKFVQQTTEASQYGSDDQKVRLLFIDNKPETSIILLNWIQFLIEKAGRNNLINILEYYIQIGWISEPVSSKMMDYANGIDCQVEKPTWKLLPEDHKKSLLFIEQLRGHKIDKNQFSRLERELDKIIHDSELLIP